MPVSDRVAGRQQNKQSAGDRNNKKVADFHGLAAAENCQISISKLIKSVAVSRGQWAGQ